MRNYVQIALEIISHYINLDLWSLIPECPYDERIIEDVVENCICEVIARHEDGEFDTPEFLQIHAELSAMFYELFEYQTSDYPDEYWDEPDEVYMNCIDGHRW